MTKYIEETKNQFREDLKAADMKYTLACITHDFPIEQWKDEMIRAYLILAIANGFCFAATKALAPGQPPLDAEALYTKEQFLADCAKAYDATKEKAMATTRRVQTLAATLESSMATKQ